MKPTKSFAALLLLAALSHGILAIGSVHFVGEIAELQEPKIDPSLEPTDALVVLTGGRDRLTTGFELLMAGKAKKLFISGVYPGLTLDHLIGPYPIPSDLKVCCIVLGHTAGSTRGNALETSQWMDTEHFQSLRLVTANYHMQRSVLIFHNAMPTIAIKPYPIIPENVSLDGWWTRPGTTKLLVTEYLKYLYAIVRIRLGL